jgi:G:T-mismatch repair DNA endonuclease (very short patch repair protein)
VLNKFCADGKKCSSHKAWNKGLTRESNASIERQARWMEQNNPRLGKTAWNKGLTKETSKSMLSVSLKNMFRYPTEETRKKMSISASKRKVHGMLGKRHSQRLKNFMRDVTIERLKRDSNNGKSSSIELIFKKFLKRHNVKFVHQKKLGRYLYDFLIFIGDKKIVVECHGIYWHWHPRFFGHKKSIPIAVQKNLIRDKSKAKFINRSKKVDGMVVMWEHQIKCEKSIWITFKSKIRALFQSKNWELEAFMI